MKNIKLILVSLLFIAFIGCEEDERDTFYLDSVEAPSEFDIQFGATQDNTGLITITPTAIGATLYTIDFGDGSEPENVNPTESVDHIYAEGNFTIIATAIAINGLTTEIERSIDVIYISPQNLAVTIQNDGILSNTVNVNATADFGISYQVDFGELEGDDDVVSAPIGEEITYEYQQSGTYTITVTAFSAASEPAQYIEENFVVTEVFGDSPIAGTWKMSEDEGFLVGEGGAVYFDCNSGNSCASDRACYFDDLYVFSSDGAFTNDLGAETWIEGWQGGGDSCGTPVAPHDGSNPATYSFNTDASTITLNGVGAYIGLPKAINGAEISNPADAPESITYNVVELTDDNTRMVLEVFINATIFWRYTLEKVSDPSPIEGTWVMSENEGFLVGEGGAVYFDCNSGNGCATDRACYFDDQYVFNSDGSFNNILGAETWIEGWQGGSDSCGAPVAPHDGSNPATYTYDSNANTLTLNGVGAYLGLPKAINGAEISDPANAPASITYNVVEITDSNTRMVVEVFINATIFWRYTLVKI